eukprot:3614734-Pyramimonas_sp.AAC.1
MPFAFKCGVHCSSSPFLRFQRAYPPLLGLQSSCCSCTSQGMRNPKGCGDGHTVWRTRHPSINDQRVARAARTPRGTVTLPHGWLGPRSALIS